MKVVINTCYGGFGLSPKATKRLAKLEGRECYFFEQDFPEKAYIPVSVEQASGYCTAFDIPNPNALRRSEEINRHLIHYSDSMDRSDPKLLQVVEELGKEANGDYAKLSIVEIPDGINWVIDAYDGIECVEEAHRSWY